MTRPVCLVLGAGAGIGGNVAKRFAREGYHACLARRTDKEGLDRLVADIQAEGGSASGYLLNERAVPLLPYCHKLECFLLPFTFTLV